MYFFSILFCYPEFAALVNSQGVPSFTHIEHLDERLFNSSESKNRPNVFCCEHFVEMK